MVNETKRPWWRERVMWLVVGGPVVVVLAGLVTVWIAARGADRVLPREQVSVSSPADLPALQGRNHVADPQKVVK